MKILILFFGALFCFNEVSAQDIRDNEMIQLFHKTTDDRVKRVLFRNLVESNSESAKKFLIRTVQERGIPGLSKVLKKAMSKPNKNLSFKAKQDLLGQLLRADYYFRSSLWKILKMDKKLGFKLIVNVIKDPGPTPWSVVHRQGALDYLINLYEVTQDEDFIKPVYEILKDHELFHNDPYTLKKLLKLARMINEEIQDNIFNSDNERMVENEIKNLLSEIRDSGHSNTIRLEAYDTHIKMFNCPPSSTRPSCLPDNIGKQHKSSIDFDNLYYDSYEKIGPHFAWFELLELLLVDYNQRVASEGKQFEMSPYMNYLSKGNGFFTTLTCHTICLERLIKIKLLNSKIQDKCPVDEKKKLEKQRENLIFSSEGLPSKCIHSWGKMARENFSEFMTNDSGQVQNTSTQSR